MEHTSGVDSFQEVVSGLLVLRDDDVRVAGPVPVDVVDGFRHPGDHLDCAFQVPKLDSVGGIWV